MAQTSYRLASSSTLSDDFIMTADVLVSEGTTSSVAVFRIDDAPCALFVRADGVLCQIASTSGASAAGWSVSPVGSTSGVTQVVVGPQPGEGTSFSVHAFYTDDSSTYHIELIDGTWGMPAQLPLVSGLSLAFNPENSMVAYGIDSAGHLALFLQATDGSWSSTSLAASASLAGLKPALVLTSAVNDWSLAVPGSAETGGYLDIYQGDTSAVLSGPEHVPVPEPVSAAVLGFYSGISPMFLFTDTSDSVYMSVGTAAVVQPIPNASAVQAAAVVDESDMLHVYMVDSANTLSVLHQTGSSGADNAPVWAPIIPLDKGLQFVYTDPSPLATPALFAIDQESVLWHYVQDPTTTLWSAGKAQMPGEQAYRIAQYRTEITVRDQNESPAAGVSLSVTAATGSAIMQGGVRYPVGPSTSVTVTTNPFGNVTLSTIASGLSSPALTVAAEGTTLIVNPAADVHDYLAGARSTLNEGTSAALPAFGAATLQQARVNGIPLAPAAQGEGGTTLAGEASQGISQMFQMQVKGNTVPPATARPVAFAVDLSDRANPRFQALYTDEDYQAYRHGFFASELGGIGSWWSDIEDFLSDVWNGIESAAIAVTKFVVHIANATIDFVAQVAGQIVNIVGAAVRGIEDLVSAVQGIFAWIGAEVDKLIDWLKMLFDWDAILNTTQALESAMAQAFPYMQNVIGQWSGTLVNGFFGKLETDVSNAFDTVIARYQGVSMGSLVPAGSSPYAPQSPAAVAAPAGGARRFLRATASPRALAAGGAGGMSTDDFNNWQGSGQNNWLLDKIESFLGMAPTLNVVKGLAGQFEQLKSDFDPFVADFQQACQDFSKFFIVALTDPTQIATVGVADLLNAAKNVALAVLALLDAIVETLLDVVSTALNKADELLTAPLDIPVLTAIWNGIGSLLGIKMPNITVATLLSGGLAIPITLLFKIANGVDTEPFPNGALPTGAASAPPAGEAMLALGAAGDPGDDATAKFAIQCTAGGIAAMWALMDTGLDCVPDVDLMIFNLLDLLAPTLLGVFTWPGGIPFAEIPMETAADKAAFANWIIGWVPVGLGLAFLVAGPTAWAGTPKVARYIDPAGKILLTASGAIGLTAGIVASALGASSAGIAANILGPLPVLCQFLRLSAFEGATGEVTLAIKLVIDFFAGEGLAVAIFES